MRDRRWISYGALLGVALGGFFDGILLHQILQWHHLLSLVPGVEDLRMQVLWDGYFHALMYVLAAIGLWGLWRARRSGGSVAGPRLGGALLAGFGLWHVLDGILSHWLLGIHRIKLDAENPLMWDLGWFLGFGVLPLALGILMLRRPDSGRRVPSRALMLLTVVATGAGAWAMRPPPEQPFTTLVFRPGTAPARIFAALAATDGRLVWTDRQMGVVVVSVAPEHRWRFYRHGALLVSGSGLPAGCFDWSAV